MDSAKDEYQSLRAVDPGAYVERPGAGPESGDLAVPAFVGGQRGALEGKPREEREREGKRAKEWGPPRPNLDRRTAIAAAVALLLALGAAVEASGLTLGPDRYLLVLLVPALVLRRARRYLLDFIPFAGLIVLYAQFRGIAHLLHPHPFYTPQLRLEQWLFDGQLPTAYLQSKLWTGSPVWYDTLTYKVLQLHFIVAPLLGFVLWVRRRALFYRFAAAMITVSFAGAITFFLFPSAPPWAAADKGLLPTVTKLPVPNPAPQPAHGLSSISLSDLVTPNPYAAIPSLHAGYAFLAFFFIALVTWRTRWRWWAIALVAIYPLAECFAVVYTANHYVVDLIIGAGFAAGGIAGVEWLWRRRGWPQ